MKIILEDFYYKGFYFEKYETEITELGDKYNESMDSEIHDIIKRRLDYEIWQEINTRT